MKCITVALFAAMLSASVWALDKNPNPPVPQPGVGPLATPAPNPQNHPNSKAEATAAKLEAIKNKLKQVHDANAAAGHPDAAATTKKPADAKPRAEKGAAKPKDKDKEKDEEAAKGNDDKLDFIEMITGDKMYGKIHKEMPDSVILLVNKEVGRIVVPKDRIRTLNFSMDTRLKALEEDDYAGRFKVAQWAIEKNMYPQAIDLLEDMKTVEDKTGVDNGDINKELGKAYEAQHQLDKALDAYKEYKAGLKDGVVDAELDATIKRLDLEVNPPIAETAKAAKKIVEGLEADGNWMGEGWDNANKCAIGKSIDKDTGNNMISITSAGGVKDKSAFSRYGQQPLDLRESSEMVFKIFNKSDQAINLACAFVNAQGDFHESKAIKIAPKTWADHGFKVEGKVFKSNRNDFKDWNLELAGKEHISRITFLVYSQKPYTLYVDGLFFKEAKKE